MENFPQSMNPVDLKESNIKGNLFFILSQLHSEVLAKKSHIRQLLSEENNYCSIRLILYPITRNFNDQYYKESLSV